MTDQTPEQACPPHRWEITLVRMAGGLHDHYRCLRCAAEKDVARQVGGWGRRTAGRPRSQPI
jgi:hypothetical protein